jgi:D-aminopeptidase
VPGIEGAAVKWGLEEKHRLGALSVRRAVSLSPEKSRSLIKETARRAMKLIGSVEPFTMRPPYVMKVEYTERKYAEASAMNPGVQRVDENTVTQTRGRLQELVF